MTAVLPSPPDPDPDPGPIQPTPVLPVGFLSDGSAEPAAVRDTSSIELPFSTVRRWRRVLTTIAAGVTVGALAVTAIGWFTSQRSAQRWHRHADASDLAVRSAVATVSALQSQLDDTRAQLSSSQADARSLQGRLDQLAAEKAKVEDERESMKTINARLQEISQALSVAVAGANNCSSQAMSLLQRASRGSLTATQAETEAARIDGVCQKADADRQTVVDLLDRLTK